MAKSKVQLQGYLCHKMSYRHASMAQLLVCCLSMKVSFAVLSWFLDKFYLNLGNYSWLQAFMFESSLSFRVTEWANKTKVDGTYFNCWQPLKKHFTPPTSTDTGNQGTVQCWLGLLVVFMAPPL